MSVDAVVVHRSGVRHAGLYFVSGSDRVYASLYTPGDRPARLGVVLCQTWAVEGFSFIEWCHRVAHDVAAEGVAAIVPHWPGTQDSDGDATTLTFDRMVSVGLDAAAATEERCEVPTWGTVGVRLGAAAAARLAPALNASRLVLVQPSLDPAGYFEEQERIARRGSLGVEQREGWLFNHPTPSGLRDPAEAARVQAALAAYAGDGVVVRYRRPAIDPPTPFRTITTWGDWRRLPRVDHCPLRVPTVRWLAHSVRGDR